MTPGKRLPSEFAINMMLDKVAILQQGDLELMRSYDYFNEKSPCHIYFICKRPRVVIDKARTFATDEYVDLYFKIQKEDTFEELHIQIENVFGTTDVVIDATYPNSRFELLANGEVVFEASAAVFLQQFYQHLEERHFLDLDVLYIGQSFGVEGARTAPDRLKSHSTLQNIYAEAISINPDCEIWLVLASFLQINLMMFDGRTEFTDEERRADKVRFQNVYNKLNWEGINEQQKINFTEAALIRYFEPPYNKVYKDSFPNPAHVTYTECYDLDVNAVCIELQTFEKANFCLYSEKARAAPWHMQNFPLHSPQDRKSMFEIH
jgi:hypothetical protein